MSNCFKTYFIATYLSIYILNTFTNFFSRACSDDRGLSGQGWKSFWKVSRKDRDGDNPQLHASLDNWLPFCTTAKANLQKQICSIDSRVLLQCFLYNILGTTPLALNSWNALYTIILTWPFLRGNDKGKGLG